MRRCSRAKQDQLAKARVASADLVVAVLDITEVASPTGRGLELVATVYFALDLHLNYGWVRERVTALPGGYSLADAGAESDRRRDRRREVKGLSDKP